MSKRDKLIEIAMKNGASREDAEKLADAYLEADEAVKE